jgi:putative DNA primase/helicase
MDELDAAIIHLEERGRRADDLIVPAPSNPMAVARQFVAERYTLNGRELVLHHRGDFHTFDGRCWPEAESRTIRAELYRWLEDAFYEKKLPDGGVALVPFEPNRKKLGDVAEAVAAIGHLPQSVAPPVWLDGSDAADYVVMANGILHVPTRHLRPHDPSLYAVHGLDFDYDEDAPYPSRIHGFLDELWGEDAESKDTLAEIFGYVIAGGTSQQKMFLFVGPKRSGKGTIARVLQGILGVHHVTSPTLASLTTNFGLQDLVGKPLAVISDARLGSRTDGLVAVERLLSISGEDSITVDRKYRDPWTGRLPTRFMILTNEIPRFTDSSGALASRFILLSTTKSFYGRENPMLTDELLSEAPGILNWALAGLDRLSARGYFQQPSTSAEAIRHLEDLSSPVSAFVRDRCLVGPAHSVQKDALYADWRSWCEREGIARISTKITFARDLIAAVPGVHEVRQRDGDDRIRLWGGIAQR